MSSIVNEIDKARDCGVVYCGLKSVRYDSPGQLAAAFGLKGKELTYAEVDEPTARDITFNILHRDLAYSTVIIEKERATDLTEQFFCLVKTKNGGDAEMRFFSNGMLGTMSSTGSASASWNPATDATFDTGVLVLGDRCSACVWVEDED